MENWLKENWFKILILLIVLFFFIVYFLIRVKEHNLDVVNSIRLCANLSPNTEAVKDCSEAIKKNYIKFFSD